MAVKSYISVIFILVFFGKLVTMDARIFSIILDSSEVTLVNNLCPKKQLLTDSPEEFATANLSPVLEVHHLCQTAFDIAIDHTPEARTANNFRKYTYREPAHLSIPGNRFYPPPRA